MEGRKQSPSSSPCPAHAEELRDYDEARMEQNDIFSDCVKDLKNLQSQLYSAAEYFESSYTTDDHKQIVVNSLKDHVIKALINTVDHLGFVSITVDDLISEKVDEISEVEVQVYCIEQTIQTYKDHMDHQGHMQQTLVFKYPKYQKRYTSQGGHLEVCQELMNESVEDHLEQELSPSVDGTRPSLRKACSSTPQAHPLSPSPQTRFPPLHQYGRAFTLERRLEAALTANSSVKPGSFTMNPVNEASHSVQHPGMSSLDEPRHQLKSSRAEGKEGGYLQKNSRKTRAFLKSLLGNQKSRNEEVKMYSSYMDEYEKLRQ